MNDLFTVTLLTLSALVIILVGIIVYLLVLLGKIEELLDRMSRRLLRPQVPRDGQGRPLRERL